MAGAEKNQLIEQHLSLVQAIAHKVKKSLSTSIDVEDLIGYGSKGLVEAAERFDARQGVAFSTFAYYRIRGAMYDGLRTMGWYSRADYARYRAEERANEYLQSQADREGAARAGGAAPTATGSDSAEGTLAEVATVLAGVGTVHITSMDAAIHVVDERLPPPDAQLEMREVTGRLREAVAQLPEKERRLMELYYQGDKNLEEAGREMGLSKSWACRLHARAVDLLRIALADAL
jgi:RNA polymerase sigma factor for flagellar operon FliA